MKTSTTCSSSVDYSQVPGEKILPFVFTLNEEDSILHPKEGEYQRFCYDVEGVDRTVLTGSDGDKTENLSYFLLGICKNITKDNILDISVVINGIPQEVVWGENVEIKTEENPDSSTKCTGLKFNFPLDKDGGRMQVCITLAQTYSIGPVNVCAFGGDVTATGLSICGPVCGSQPSCDTTFYQTETVCVPVTVTPFADPKVATARCCGDPIVTIQDNCPAGKKACKFTVTQPLCIEVQLAFGADVQTGDASVICGDVNQAGCNCGSTVSSAAANTARKNLVFK